MIVSINQPAYLPWLGYFERIARSSLHVVLDHVQFEKNSFTNRNKIRLKSGTAWLTVPLASKGRFGSLEIQGLEFAERGEWQKKHWSSLQMNYARTAYFSSYAEAYASIYNRTWPCFMPFVQTMLQQHLEDLKITTRIAFSSQMGISGSKSDLILNICKAVGASIYLSGSQGRNYLKESAFEENGIQILYQNYEHPSYPQAWPGFESHLCILDLLFNHGPESMDILLANQPGS